MPEHIQIKITLPPSEMQTVQYGGQTKMFIHNWDNLKRTSRNEGKKGNALEKILRPKRSRRTDFKYKLGSYRKLYVKFEYIITSIQKIKRFYFYGHVKRMDNNRLVKEILADKVGDWFRKIVAGV